MAIELLLKTTSLSKVKSRLDTLKQQVKPIMALLKVGAIAGLAAYLNVLKGNNEGNLATVER
jgi:hypothetical protein